jgi:serine/threonine protein kinase
MVRAAILGLRHRSGRASRPALHRESGHEHALASALRAKPLGYPRSVMQVSTVTSPAAAAKPGTDAANALPAGHRLHEFELRGVIGVGGFGIVYRAFDHSLEREVAIKEYLPAALAGRSGKQQVSLLSASHSETFALGMSSFVNEAKLLARFDHPSLLKVHRFWEDNGTAYMVMPLYRGSTLRQLRQASGRCPDGAWLMRLLDALLGALDVMHREGVYHRDIAPDNVIVADDAPPVLLDFGAARRVISDRSQALTAILKPSYAPLEQYAESTGMRQGPWTDFYALGATLHFVITGRPPVPATARALSDEQPRLAGSTFGNVPDLLLQVCDWMLAPRPDQRPQHVAELRAALSGHLPVPRRERPSSATAWQTTVVQQPARASPAVDFEPSELPAPRAGKRRWRRGVPLWGTAVAMVLAASVAWWASNLQHDDAPVAGSTVANTAGLAGAAPAVPARPAPSSAEPADAPRRDAGTRADAADHKPAADAARTPRVRPAPMRAAQRAEPRAVDSRVPPSVVPPGAETQANPAPVVHNEPPAAAPTQAPVSVAAVTRNPREQCAGRHLVAMHRCLLRECDKPEFQGHRECQRVRDIETRTRNVLGS